MAKVLRTVLKVAAVVGSVIGGPIGWAVAIGATLGSSLLSKKAPAQAVSPASYERLRANVDPRTPRKTAVGHTALATDIRDEEFTDSQTYFHRFIVCASHKVQSIDEIWFDDEMAWSAAGGVVSKFTGYLTVATRAEGTAGNAINISARMSSTRRYTGLAYVHLRYRLTGLSSKVDSPFAQSITTRITIRGKAALLYDPRADSTVAGGSGSQRAATQSTWAWDDDACRNPALALLFYLLGWRINGELVIGKGIPPERIDLESFAVAANICDEPVSAIGGGTEPRYRCDGVWSEGDAPTTVIDQLKSAMNADLDDVDGKLRLTVFHNDLATPDADFTANDILDDFEWDAAADLSESFSTVRGLYTDPSDESLYQMVDYPEVTEASPDGIDRIEPVDFPLVQSAGQAQRLAQLRLMRQKFGGTFSAVFQATAWKVQKNSVIRLTFPARGFANKLFRVAEMDIRVDGTVPLVLREEDAAIYGAPTITAPVDAIASTPYDPTLGAFVQQFNSTAQVELVSYRNFAADYTGAVLSGLLPETITPQVLLGGADIRTADTVSYSISTSGVTATVNNTTGSADKGKITITAIAATNGYIDMTVTINGTAYPAKRVVIQKSVGLPSGFGGTGSKIASDNGFASISGTSFVAITDTLTVTLASGESLYGTAPIDALLQATGTSDTRIPSGKWQHSPTGTGTWTDFASAITGDATIEQPDGEIQAGACAFTQSATGLPAATYDVRLVARLNTTGRTVLFTGTATIEAKV